MSTALLSTTFFGPVQWYQKLHRYNHVLIEQHETFQKQTYRNRCLIATTQGVQALTVPVVHEQEVGGEKCDISCIRLSDHGNWRHQHWQALQTAYGDSPFLEYYEDDLRPFFTEHNWELLIDYNEAICRKMCELLDIRPEMERTSAFLPPLTSHPSSLTDFRDVIHPKHPLPDPDFRPMPYYQVCFAKSSCCNPNNPVDRSSSFLANLSILDLLLNMGPESIFYL